MANTDRSTKDKAMAARMKREGVVRTSARCPICHKLVGLTALYSHVVFHT